MILRECDGIMLKVKTVVVGAYSVNCYIVYCDETGDGIIIDPGDEAKRIKYNVDALDGINIKMIVLTHAHSDHICAVNELKEYYGVEVALHEEEDDIYSKGLYNLTIVMADVPIADHADILLKEGDAINVGNNKLVVMHTPGHTKGSMCLYGDGMLFSGDTLFAGTYGRTDFPTGDEEKLAASIHRLLCLPDNTVVYPGHYESTTIKTENKYNQMAKNLIENYL